MHLRIHRIQLKQKDIHTRKNETDHADSISIFEEIHPYYEVYPHVSQSHTTSREPEMEAKSSHYTRTRTLHDVQ
jgi:methionine synthase II (cobalamin-independent)